MKSLLQFLSESQAVQQATRMGLKSDGHGGWYDNKGEFIAKTEKGTLKFFNKRQRIGAQDPKQSEKEKRISAGSSAKPAAEPVSTIFQPFASIPHALKWFLLLNSQFHPGGQI